MRILRVFTLAMALGTVSAALRAGQLTPAGLGAGRARAGVATRAGMTRGGPLFRSGYRSGSQPGSTLFGKAGRSASFGRIALRNVGEATYVD